MAVYRRQADQFEYKRGGAVLYVTPSVHQVKSNNMLLCLIKPHTSALYPPAAVEYQTRKTSHIRPPARPLAKIQNFYFLLLGFKKSDPDHQSVGRDGELGRNIVIRLTFMQV